MKVNLNSKRARIFGAAALLALIVSLLVVFTRGKKPFPRTDPNIGKETGVTIDGTVSLNGKTVTSGFVVAWQGAPVSFAQVQNDGSYHIANAPLGKCLITYSTSPPGSVALDKAMGLPPMPDPAAMGKMGAMPPFPIGERGPPKGLPRPSAQELKAKMPFPPGNGKMPFPPDGKMPFPPDGKFPFPPDGKMPFPPDGKMPFPPDGKLPFPPDGKLPFPPDGKMPFPPKDGEEPPFGNMPPPPSFLMLDPETKKLNEGASRKYGDPANKLIEFETRKGANSLSIYMSTP